MLKIMNSIAKKMLIDFEEITSEIKHRGEKGSAREDIFMNYMRQFIPKKFGFTKGEIFASSSDRSRQVDCIIYDEGNTPIFINQNSTKVIPIESVYISIEVKSVLNKKSLQECVTNIQSVRMLKKSSNSPNYSNVHGFVFAFTSNSLDTIITHLKKANEKIRPEERISAICVLDKGLIVNVDKDNMQNITVNPSKNTFPISAQNAKDNNLLLFYLLLMECLNKAVVSPPDLIKYAKKANLFNINLKSNIGDLPNGTQYNGWEIDVIKKMHQMQPRLKGMKQNVAEKEEVISLVLEMLPYYYELYETISSLIISGFKLNSTQIQNIKNSNIDIDTENKIYEAYISAGELEIDVLGNKKF